MIDKDAREAEVNELRVAFKSVAGEAGFAVKGGNAFRHRHGSQQRIYFYRNHSGPSYGVQLMIWLDRPEDVGIEVLKIWDTSITLAEMLMPQGIFENEHDFQIFLTTTQPTKPAPPNGRRVTLELYLRMALPWFDQMSNVEAIKRSIFDNEYRIKMGEALPPFRRDFLSSPS